MPITHAALWMLIGLALAIVGVLTVLDEILSDTPFIEPVPSDRVPYGDPVAYGEPGPFGESMTYGDPMPHSESVRYTSSGSKDSERRSGRECRT